MENLCKSYWCAVFTRSELLVEMPKQANSFSVNSEELCDECKEVLASPLPLNDEEV